MMLKEYLVRSSLSRFRRISCAVLAVPRGCWSGLSAGLFTSHEVCPQFVSSCCPLALLQRRAILCAVVYRSYLETLNGKVRRALFCLTTYNAAGFFFCVPFSFLRMTRCRQPVTGLMSRTERGIGTVRNPLQPSTIVR